MAGEGWTGLLGYLSQNGGQGDPSHRSLFDFMSDPTGVAALQRHMLQNQTALSDMDVNFYRGGPQPGGSPGGGMPAPAASSPAALLPGGQPPAPQQPAPQGGLLGPAASPQPQGGLLGGPMPPPQSQDAQQPPAAPQGGFMIDPGKMIAAANQLSRVPSQAARATQYLQMAETAMKEGKGIWQNPDGTTELRPLPGDLPTRQGQAFATSQGTESAKLPFTLAGQNNQNRLDIGKAKVQSGLDINKELTTNFISQVQPDGSIKQVPKSAMYAGGGSPGAAGPAGGITSELSPSAKAYGTASGTNMGDYEKGLNDRVQSGAMLMAQFNEVRPLLDKVKLGGGADARLAAAKIAQAMPWVPQTLVDKIAGGDVGAAEEVRKLAAQQGMETMKQLMAQGSRSNQMEFATFQKNNPQLATDPRGFEKMYNFGTRAYQRDLAEQSALGNYKQGSDLDGNPLQGNSDVTQFPNYWQGQLAQRGFITPEQVTGLRKDTREPGQTAPKITAPPVAQRIPGKTVWQGHIWMKDAQGNTGWAPMPAGGQ